MMRRDNVWLGAAFWAALAVLMPMVALEPTGAAHAATSPAAAASAASCGKGEARLMMGCESIYL